MSKLDELFKARRERVESAKAKLADIIKRKVEELRPVYKSPVDMQKVFGLPLHNFQKEILRELDKSGDLETFAVRIREMEVRGTLTGRFSGTEENKSNSPKEIK